jgi:coenzyme F420-reducing hydrogenase delta subunit
MAAEPEGRSRPAGDGDNHRSAKGTGSDETFSKSFEPKIVGFLCNWCSYAGADLAGVSRFQYPPNIRIIRVMCSGRIDPYIVLEAFAQGIDGVFIGGCHPGDCHYLEGNYQAQRKIKMTKQLVKRAGLEPERLRLEWVAASEGERFAKLQREFTKEIKELGPSPLSGEKPDEKLLANINAAKLAALDFRLRAIVAKERKIVEQGNVYNETKSQEEWDEFMEDAIIAEFERKRLLGLISEKSMSVKELAQEINLPTDKVLGHVVFLRKRNMLALDSIDGFTPKYISIVQEVKA